MALEKFGCLPDELLARATARQLAELQAHFRLRQEEREAEAARERRAAKQRSRPRRR